MQPGESIRSLVVALAGAHPAEITATVREALATEEDLAATIWISDIGGEMLTDLAGEKASQRIEGTLAGRSYRNLEAIVSQDHLVTPLESLGRLVGVLELHGAGLLDRADDMRVAARVITDRLIGAKGHSDVVEMARGAGDLGLAATIQYDLMPIPSYLGNQVEIGGWIEPAYDIAGDAWDYAVNAEEVYFGIFDSVGHGLRSCQLSLVTLGSFRLARRRGGTLSDIVAGVEEGLGQVVAQGEFVTGALGRARPDDGVMDVANAGHLAPIRIRGGTLTRMDWEAALPLGLDGKAPSLHSFDVEPGDSFYFFSDGVIEAMDPEEARFGVETLSDLLSRADAEERTVSTICHEVLDSVIEHVGGPLRDDATVLGVRFI
jgi:hypothetical protein